MSEIISSIFFVAPILLALLVPLLGITWVAVGSRVTWIWVAIYFAFVFYFPNASWGLVSQAADTNFYNRGTGALYFSAINILLFGLALQALVARSCGKTSMVKSNLGIPALLFWLILIGNVLVGCLIPEVHWFEIIGASGLLNIANFMLAFYILTTCIRNPSDLDKLINVLLFCAITRGIWGLVRYIAMGGDPANFYSNFQKIDVTLTFFDINDSLVATLALFIVSWRLATESCLSTRIRFSYYAIVFLELFIIVFSYRRTAWGGLALAAILFAFCQPKKQRYGLLFSFISIGLPAIIYKMLQRSGQSTHGASFFERLMPDVVSGGQMEMTTGRFSELYAAFLSIKESPIIGLGSWGRYDGSRFSELAWHHGDFGWMHSAVMHLALKSGLLGVAISIAVFIGVIRYVKHNKDNMPKAQLGIMMAGLAGVLFMLPNWLIGTPVIEYRTMQLMAFSFALPYMAYAAANQQEA